MAQPQSYPPDTLTDSSADTVDQTPLIKEQIEGTVESIHGQSATIRTGSGAAVDVYLGPQAFWRAHGYRLATGVPVKVEGWHSNGAEGPLYAGLIQGPNFEIELTDDQGFPLWVNRGEYSPDWYPTAAYFDVYFFGPPLYAFGPPPWWYYHLGPYYHGRYIRGHDFSRHPYGGPRGGYPRGGGAPRSGRRSR